MREAFGRLGLVGGVLAIFGWFAPAQAVTFSFKAVKKNTTDINPPASTVTANPGDTIELRVYASGWNANLSNSKLKTFQFQMNSRKGYYNNGGPGFVLTKGWNAARDLYMCDSAVDCVEIPQTAPTCDAGFCTLVCNSNAQCQAADPAYPVCDVPRGFRCVGAGHNPESGAFITESRPDYVFAPPLVGITALNLQNLDHVFGGTVISGGDGASDTGTEKYVGTLILVIANNACGGYSIGAINNIDVTFVQLISGATDLTFLPTIQPLTLNLTGACGACCCEQECSIATPAACTGGGCTYRGDGTVCTPTLCVPCPSIVSTNPPKCAIDARYPNAPNAGQPRFGFTQLDITFSSAPPVVPSPANIAVSVMPTDPGDPLRPSIQSVNQLSPTTYRLNLDPAKPTPTRQWTCFTYNGCGGGTQQKACLGSLPMDADQNRSSAMADLTTLITALNNGQGGTNPANLYKFDMDRSGSFTSVDLVNWVNMAVGSDQFPVLLDKSIDLACPAP